MGFKENPKQEGEGVIILLDEQRDFDRTAEVPFAENMQCRSSSTSTSSSATSPAPASPSSSGSASAAFPGVRCAVHPVDEKGRNGNPYNVVLFVRNRFTAELTVGVKDNFLFVELK